MTLTLLLFDDEGRVKTTQVTWAPRDLSSLRRNWVEFLDAHRYPRPVWLLWPDRPEPDCIWLKGDSDVALARARMDGQPTLYEAVKAGGRR